MMRMPFRTICAALSAAFSAVLFLPTLACAQAIGGVYIDAQGMLRQTASLSPDERLKILRANAVGQPNSKQLAAGSPLRKVSLKRLEAEVQRLHQQNKSLPADIRYLAGLTHVQYVFFDPARNDVILAGPAEGWKQVDSGEVVGTTTGRPVLHLEDFIVALRYAFTQQARPPFIGCSIDPTQKGLRNYAAYLRKIGRIDRSRVKPIVAGMEQAMGPQQVRLFGVTPSSRFAVMMVAADYRLKRLAMGHDRSPVKQVVNYLDLAAQRPLGRRQPQHRWWFVAEFDAIQHTKDRTAYELIGSGVKVATAPTAAKRNGRKQRPTPAARQFTATFNKHFAALAKKVPVFAELENAIGLAVAAEIIAQHYFGEVSTGMVPKDNGPSNGPGNGKKETSSTTTPSAEDSATAQPLGGARRDGNHGGRTWKPVHFLNGTDCPVAQYPVPKTVPAIASYRRARGKKWLISVSGGVEISPTQLVQQQTKPTPEESELPGVRTGIHPPQKHPRWWWD